MCRAYAKKAGSECKKRAKLVPKASIRCKTAPECALLWLLHCAAGYTISTFNRKKRTIKVHTGIVTVKMTQVWAIYSI